MRFLSVAVLAVLALVYVEFQARDILLGPTLSLEGTPQTMQHERSVALTGKARNIVKLTLNGKEIFTNERGEFTHTLILENGYTIMSLFGEDRFGRTTSLVREYVYVPGPEERISLSK